MGIPHLAQLLQPYAVNTVLGCKTPRCEKHRIQSTPDRFVDENFDTRPFIIIDGPGLAFHIYYKLLSQKPSTLNAFDAIPTYTEITSAVLRALDELQCYNLKIHRIFFDGYLPPYKRETRLKRLDGYRKDLLAFQAKDAAGASIVPEAEKLARSAATTSELLDNSVPNWKPYRGIPAPPFLVPAVLEELVKTKYAFAIDIVPWEADIFCATAARDADHDAVILMNDSDFLVHDLGWNGEAAFFNQLKLAVDRDTNCELISVPTFRNCDIARRLHLDNPKRLAFEIKSHPSTTLQAAIRRTETSPSDVDGFNRFLAEYDVASWEQIFPLYEVTDLDLGQRRELFLDPRTSELVLQATYDMSEQPVTMYLPVLIEDPTRSSAWTYTANDRFLAYSSLQLYLNVERRRQSVQEVFRQGDRIARKETELLDEPQALSHASSLLASIQQHQAHCKDRNMSPYGVWRLYAVRRGGFSDQAWDSILRGKAGAKVWKWKDVQIAARLQAVLYSLRIVQQILKHLIILHAPLPKPLSALNQALAFLPPLKVMMATRLEVLERGTQEAWDIG